MTTSVAKLFEEFRIRNVTFKNRIFVSPMCMYSSVDGFPTSFHLVHLGSRAVGGAGLVMTEATAVRPEGRISPADAGIWSAAQAAAWAPIAKFITDSGSVPAIQLAHAGRKASCAPPGTSPAGQLGLDAGGWTTQAPSPVPYALTDRPPHAMTHADMDDVTRSFVEAALRSVEAGFRVIELHAAHGYLLHEWLSPLSNIRDDEHGGSFENRVRWPLSVVASVRAALPDGIALFVRISATDWAPEGQQGWDAEQSVRFVRLLKAAGVDLVDVSTGGNLAKQQLPPLVPGYQAPLASVIRAQTGTLVSTVGMITEPHHAESLLADGHADAVFLARELLRDPYWPLHAAGALGVDVKWPTQYLRAKPAQAAAHAAVPKSLV